MQDYRNLTVWQAARKLTVAIYRWTSAFPEEERFGMVVQMRRAAISITSNIAEGCGRGGQREFARFLAIASGSAHELESQVTAATDLGFGSATEAADIAAAISEIKAMLARLAQAVRSHLG